MGLSMSANFNFCILQIQEIMVLEEVEEVGDMEGGVVIELL